MGAKGAKVLWGPYRLATELSAVGVEEIHRLFYFDKQNVEALKLAAQSTDLASEFRDGFVVRLAKLGVKFY